MTQRVQNKRRHLLLQWVLPRLFLVLSLVVSIGCWGRDQGIDPPSFAERTNTIEAATAQVQSRRVRMDEDLTAFLEAKNAFFEMPRDFWAGIPKDLFKHAAMACLNEPVGSDAEPNTAEWDAAKAMEVGCVVMPLDPLWQRTETGRRDAVAKSMRQIDRMRRFRSTLKNAFRRTPKFANSMRTMIAERRAEVRQIEREVERRKPEYSDANYDLAFERARAFRAEITRLEKAVDQLERTVPGASATLETEVEDTYIRLAKL